MKKLGFALGAGGSRGCAHIGFLKAMEEEGIRPDFVAGTSMGSVVGACYALGMSPTEMEDEVKKLKMSDILDLSINPLNNGGILRSEKLLKKLRQYIGEVKFNDLTMPFKCVATDLITGKSVVLQGDADVAKSVSASSSIPGVFKPVKLGNQLLVDGGITCRVPVKTVRKMGAKVVVAVDVLGKVRPNDKNYNMFSVLLRSFDICDSELVKYKLGRQRPDLYLEPELGNMSQYKFKDIALAIEKGYELGKANAPKIKELIK